LRINNYTQRFCLPSGKYVYVQEDGYRAKADDFLAWSLRRWRPPSYYYHYQAGGHVAALKLHHGSQYFARADIERFFWHVTRNKIVRALKRIGFTYEDAYEFAVNATVSNGGRHFLPFGFVESPFLATLCLEKSMLGETFRVIRKKGIKLSIYVDDIILSGESEANVETALELICQVGQEVGFPLNGAKLQKAAGAVNAFNINAGTDWMEISSTRMADFKEAIIDAGPGNKTNAIIAYVSTVSKNQAEELRLLITPTR